MLWMEIRNIKSCLSVTFDLATKNQNFCLTDRRKIFYLHKSMKIAIFSKPIYKNRFIYFFKWPNDKNHDFFVTDRQKIFLFFWKGKIDLNSDFFMVNWSTIFNDTLKKFATFIMLRICKKLQLSTTDIPLPQTYTDCNFFFSFLKISSFTWYAIILLFSLNFKESEVVFCGSYFTVCYITEINFLA